jgi:hypothetical protein
VETSAGVVPEASCASSQPQEQAWPERSKQKSGSTCRIVSAHGSTAGGATSVPTYGHGEAHGLS